MSTLAAQVRSNIRRANVRAVIEDISFDEAASANVAESGRARQMAIVLAVTCVLLGMSTALHYLR